MSSPEMPMVRETRTGAYGICINNGMILVIHKAKGPYKGRYDLPGGGVEFGESPAEAVAREFLEETGTSVAVKDIVGAFSRVSTFVSDTGTYMVELHHMGFLYLVTQIESDAPIKTGPDGLDSLGAVWLPLADVSPDRISPLVAEGLRYITV
ncbi:MAG TPA: NUDIX hydrolase [Symbiobacteriaceae bacterium]|nr:NUDIX hydrolase [Symbiobacteriaceae bacterium]